MCVQNFVMFLYKEQLYTACKSFDTTSFSMLAIKIKAVEINA